MLIACSKKPIVETPSKISRDKISFYEDRATINLEDYGWLYFNESNTDSMYPTITKNSHALGLRVREETPISIGDIISFKTTGILQNYAHRVIEKGVDEYGEFFITKGDNNNKKDNIKIRRQNIIYVIAAIIY
jgi:hypothetical protein